MAIRTTPQAVKGILGDHYDGKMDLDPFVASASSMVDWLADKDADSELSATQLELIERWLSAHCYAHADQLYQSKNTGKSGGSFQGQTGMALDSTMYGQMAKTLDVTGRLSKLGKERARASMTWLGTEYT